MLEQRRQRCAARCAGQKLAGGDHDITAGRQRSIELRGRLGASRCGQLVPRHARLLQHLRIDIQCRHLLIGQRLKELGRSLRVALAHLGGLCQRGQLGQGLLLALGELRLPIHASSTVQHLLQPVHQRHLPAGADQRGHQRLHGRIRPLGQVVAQRGIGLEHRPGVQVLQQRGRLLSRHLAGSRHQEVAHQRRAGFQVAQKGQKCKRLGAELDGGIAGAIDSRADRADAGLPRLAVALPAGRCGHCTQRQRCTAWRQCQRQQYQVLAQRLQARLEAALYVAGVAHVWRGAAHRVAGLPAQVEQEAFRPRCADDLPPRRAGDASRHVVEHLQRLVSQAERGSQHAGRGAAQPEGGAGANSRGRPPREARQPAITLRAHHPRHSPAHGIGHAGDGRHVVAHGRRRRRPLGQELRSLGRALHQHIPVRLVALLLDLGQMLGSQDCVDARAPLVLQPLGGSFWRHMLERRQRVGHHTSRCRVAPVDGAEHVRVDLAGHQRAPPPACQYCNTTSGVAGCPACRSACSMRARSCGGMRETASVTSRPTKRWPAP